MKVPHINPQVLGWLFLIAGICVLLLIGQRRFNRRGLGGLQHFSNYWLALIILFAEWLLKWMAYALLLLGLFLVLFG